MIKIKKLWGHEIWHHNSPDYCMKTLVLKQGYVSSLHMHIKKSETFLVVQGKIELEYDGGTVCLERGQSWDIAPGVYHRFKALTKRATVVEASTFHREEDVYRKENSSKL